MDEKTVAQYAQLLTALPEEAQWWITGMGWGLQDLRLDSHEIALLDYMASQNRIENVSVFSRPDIINGVTAQDVTRIKNWLNLNEITSVGQLLEDDLSELQQAGILQGQEELHELILLADQGHYEILKGLCLIDNFGRHVNDRFSYQIPEYNTQLHVLGQILEKGIPDGFEVAAVAAGLDYGSLWTISDEQVRAKIPEYAKALIEFHKDTEKDFLPERNAIWKPSTYTLEENITLMWGLPGSLYQDEEFQGGMQYEFKSRQFTMDDWNYSVFKIKYFEELRDFLINDKVVIWEHTSDDLDRLANKLKNLWYNRLLDYQWDIYDEETETILKRMMVFGRNIERASTGSMNWQWMTLKGIEMDEEGFPIDPNQEPTFDGRFIGGSGDAYIKQYMDQAIGIPPFLAVDVVHTDGYINPLTHSLSVGSEGVRQSLNLGFLIDKHFGWDMVRWDNWSSIQNLEKYYMGSRARLLNFDFPVEMWKNGVPEGYIFRRNNCKEIGFWIISD